MKPLTLFFTLCCESFFRFALRYISVFLLACSHVKFLPVIYIFPAHRWFCPRASNLCQIFSSLCTPSLRVSKTLYRLLLIFPLHLYLNFPLFVSSILLFTFLSNSVKRMKDNTSILPSKFRRKKGELKMEKERNGTIKELIYIYVYV